MRSKGLKILLPRGPKHAQKTCRQYYLSKYACIKRARKKTDMPGAWLVPYADQRNFCHKKIIMSANKQTTNWCFTLNNYTEDEVASIQGLDVKYVIYGKEVGESGTPHLQGYVNLSRTQKLSYVTKMIPRAHWTPCNGTPQQNIDYCSKQGDVWTKGVAPKQRMETGGKEGGKRTRETWEKTLELAKNGTLEEIEPELQIKYYSTLRAIKKDYGKRPADLEVDSGWKGILWIVGPPGCGKSKYVRDTWKPDEIYDKSLNKWWDSYGGEKIALLDDFGKAHGVLGEHIKRWGDRYSFPAEIKGGKIDIRPERVVVTSNYFPHEIWEEEKDPALLAAIMRRTEVMDM